MNFKRSLLIGFVLAAAAFAYSQTVENVILMIPDGCSGNLIEL
jgi:alkaline phosphatase